MQTKDFLTYNSYFYKHGSYNSADYWKKHLNSVFDNEHELLKAILKIHCDNKDIELDPMYFKGKFYKDYAVNKPRFKSDINPQLQEVRQADARKLPYLNNSIKSMVLDPPFMFGIHGKTKEYYSSATHGIFQDFKELEDLYKGILKEAYRILENNGILIFKCQDYTDSKSTMTHCFVYNWALELGFYAKDLAVLNKPKNKISNSKLTQRHLRKVHTYFWIFKKQKKMGDFTQASLSLGR